MIPGSTKAQVVTIHSTTTVSITAEVIDPNAITPTPTPTPGGGGGGGGGVSMGGQVKFSGKAYPGTLVTLLQDAKIVGTTKSAPDASFSLMLSNVNTGAYVFSLFSEDYQGNRSSLVTFSVAVSSAGITYVSNIFIAPTISLDKQQVKQGDPLKVFGQSTPGADIELLVHSANELSYKTHTDPSGIYLFTVDSGKLDFGDHSTQARALLEEDESFLSKSLSFQVGLKNILTIATGLKGDLNSDSKVNLVDFSIMAYWYKRSNFPPKVDLNADEKISITDFSIMIYNWTG
ncbi:MAG: dockerin type I domain-containing protein [Patescibacteria group bacterium]